MTEFGKEITGATSFIDKLSQGQYFFFILNIFLLLDSCLVVFYRKNMLEIDSAIQSSISQRPIGIIVVFVISFLFIHHFFFGAVRHSVRKYIIWPPYRYIYLQYIKQDINTDRDYRNIIAVELEAVRNQDKFTLERVKKFNESYSSMELVDKEVFTFACLSAINIWFVGSPDNATITQSLIYFLRDIDSVIRIPILQILFYAVVCIFFWVAIQELIPKEEIIYAPRTTKSKPT